MEIHAFGMFSVGQKPPTKAQHLASESDFCPRNPQLSIWRCGEAKASPVVGFHNVKQQKEPHKKSVLQPAVVDGDATAFLSKPTCPWIDLTVLNEQPERDLGLGESV